MVIIILNVGFFVTQNTTVGSRIGFRSVSVAFIIYCCSIHIDNNDGLGVLEYAVVPI